MHSTGKRSRAGFLITDRLSRMSEKLQTNRGVYESFVLKGVVPELSWFSGAVIIYQSFKVLFGLLYAVNVLPGITLYHVVSSALLLLYLPICLNIFKKYLRLAVYMRCVMAVQISCLALGSLFVYNGYRDRYTKETETVLKVTSYSMVFEWAFILITIATRGFVAVGFQLFITLTKGVLRKLYSVITHEKKQNTS
ncbi:uncharacterized protein LOC121384444 [Gigantopelta aegis]|uniref:uncharacterized protein LOC121384444 n=1 Tax=Gigantopelta aegis TaxID=1735272 RepID=UPI001B88CB12|nr:uncharacterized protein LOC121384444 [Gigantopelta aegis]